jgi:hypothetical protein
MPPRREGLRLFFLGQAGGGVLTRETETRDPNLGRGGGGGLEASEGPTGPPGV